MKILVGNFESISARRGLYRVWLRAVEGEPTPLVARWIDPNARTNGNETREEATALADVEAMRRCLRTHLLAA
jgi:hypothetical protein